MKQKSMGSFIAALRKANGLTQKDLAEKLNVSDKTVSRWERDEGTPDLSMIPAIAEIFGVTCDELLRGERNAPGDRESDTGGENITVYDGQSLSLVNAVFDWINIAFVIAYLGEVIITIIICRKEVKKDVHA